ncbi:hypothetical protein N658DRAFT_140134 [Parathielavia hyrcaniae]|uniref:Uncharacterized protein n=1 Tax=Parathielavia hyrcaniae TaxID=113614 RepID=A0AAN6T025_9PEZI|nr:hypothetical protein N658DRAFT_140134 [Parathielavia hyrcaniae]
MAGQCSTTAVLALVDSEPPHSAAARQDRPSSTAGDPITCFHSLPITSHHDSQPPSINTRPAFWAGPTIFVSRSTNKTIFGSLFILLVITIPREYTVEQASRFQTATALLGAGRYSTSRTVHPIYNTLLHSSHRSFLGLNPSPLFALPACSITPTHQSTALLVLLIVPLATESPPTSTGEVISPLCGSLVAAHACPKYRPRSFSPEPEPSSRIR